MILIVQIALGVCLGQLLYRAVTETSSLKAPVILRRVVFAIAVVVAAVLAAAWFFNTVPVH